MIYQISNDRADLAQDTNIAVNDLYIIARNEMLGDSKGVLAGKQYQPREICAFAHAAGFKLTWDLFHAVAVCLAESQGYVKASNDNFNAAGKISSRDCGLMQINIPADQIGTAVESDLYDPELNFKHAFKLHEARGWQPWAAFNSGVYLHDYYSARACLGVMNYLAEGINGDGATLPVPIFTLRELRDKVKW